MTAAEEPVEFVDPPHPAPVTLKEKARRFMFFSWVGMAFMPKIVAYCWYDFGIIYDLVR